MTILIRKAVSSELCHVYMMGFDVWGGDCSVHDYLELCGNSHKYALGSWYVLSHEGDLVSSVIEYQNCWGLDAGY